MSQADAGIQKLRVEEAVARTQAQTKATVSEKGRKLEQQRKEGKARKAGQTWTLEQWLSHWLNSIVAPPSITDNGWNAIIKAGTSAGNARLCLGSGGVV